VKGRLVIEAGADEMLGDALLGLVETQIKAAAEADQFDRIEGLLAWRRGLSAWLDGAAVAELSNLTTHEPPDPLEPAAPPKPSTVRRMTMVSAAAWYRAREGRGVTGLADGNWQIEGREEPCTQAVLVSEIKKAWGRSHDYDLVVEG